MTTEIVVSFDDTAASGRPVTINLHGLMRHDHRVLYLTGSTGTPVSSPVLAGFPAAERPVSALGRRLREIRARIVASGEPLLDGAGIERELWEGRGELTESAGDAHLR